MEFVPALLIIGILAIIISKNVTKRQYKKLEEDILKELGYKNWDIIPYIDDFVTVKSRQALEKYDDITFFKDNKDKLEYAEKIINCKNSIALKLRQFIDSNEYESKPQYYKFQSKIFSSLKNADAYRVNVRYITSAGNNLAEKEIVIEKDRLNTIKNNPTLLMSKGEYNKYIKEQQKEELAKKQHKYYEDVNQIIDYANANRASLVNKESRNSLDNLIAQLFDRTVNSIKKIKTLDSEEWQFIGSFIDKVKYDIQMIVSANKSILDYYESDSFAKIKDTCEVLMSTQREFNEYIEEKIESISKLFGTRVVRNETIVSDDANYIRPYKKTVTPFTAEVSATVFASAENNPLDYVVKYFYPDKKSYPEQIQKLYHLVEELETLKDAKQIIENYKVEYQQYLGDVPEFVMKNDEAGFYSRLGFANIDEEVLNVEYKFSYTSGGGLAQRSFTIPMTEETIAELIKALQSKLTAKAFVKEQRNLMTKKLRESIKKRDNYTCCNCGNSTHKEPNLLLEIDHIIPVSKGGCTEEGNLQTLCWKCNRSKSNKIL